MGPSLDPNDPRNMTPEAFQQWQQSQQIALQLAQAQRDAAQAQINLRPKMPEYTGLADEEGNLKDRFKMKGAGNYKDLAMQGLNQQKYQAMSDATQAGMGSNSAARTALATRGGLSGGNALRLAALGQQNAANTNQGIQSQALKGQQAIGEKEFNLNKEADTSNTENLIKNQAGLNAYNLGKYQEGMKAWASEQSANAQAKAGEK